MLVMTLFLLQNYKFVHLSAGDLLREEQNTDGSEHGELIKEYIKLGKIVPVEITCGLLKKVNIWIIWLLCILLSCVQLVSSMYVS